jgi:aminomethyltransferase
MASELKKTALYDLHVGLGAKIVEFGGWDMPLSYGTGTVAEHRACRESAVIFDVSHLGTVEVRGTDSHALLQEVLTNDLGKISPGRAQYTHLLDENAFVLDDIIVWWRGEHSFDVMPNASNTSRVIDAIGGVDVTQSRCVLAIQGPKAKELVAKVAPEAAAIGRFKVADVIINHTPCVVAGTGYTGEDGLEIAIPHEAAPALFAQLVEAGVIPAGLGARDTLRLEAGLPLHGHELGAGITPLQAGLGWVVGWDKSGFRGRDALLIERAEGPRRLLRGFMGPGRQPLRDHASITVGGDVVGVTTSGNFSPMLERGIAMGFVDTAINVPDGENVSIDVRGRSVDVVVESFPFWPPKER